jgi:UDP-2,4-diacetamido-2,4,6-trideoxy-beta-L-altropyranose hydrolase
MINEKTKIVFRADGNNKIGMGHFFRALSLAEMLSENFFIVFGIQTPTTFQKKCISNICDEILELPQDHYKPFLDSLFGDEIVVLDNYYFKTEYQLSIKNKKCKLVCIDDMQDRHYVSDLVINHAPGLSVKKFSCEKYTKLCLGLDYLVLRKPFMETSYREVDTVSSVFICFGGSDPLNLTIKSLKACLNIPEILECNIVTGPFYEFKEELDLYNKKAGSRIRIFKNLNANQMVDLMMKSHLAIVPGSGVLLEAVCAYMPILTGFYTENQKNILNGTQSLPNVMSIGDFNSISLLDLEAQIKKAIHHLTKVKPYIVERKSGERFTELFMSLSRLI